MKNKHYDNATRIQNWSFAEKVQEKTFQERRYACTGSKLFATNAANRENTTEIEHNMFCIIVCN